MTEGTGTIFNFLEVKKTFMEQNEEETAQRVVTYMALEAELKKHKRILEKAIRENKNGSLDDYIAMRKRIIEKIEASKEVVKINDTQR